MTLKEKLKLSQLEETELHVRELDGIRGGTGNCGCGCNYETTGGSSIANNRNTNVSYDYTSYGGNVVCTKPSVGDPNSLVDDPYGREN